MHKQRGNVFLFVLMGVVLFAALAFVISRGMRSETTTGISRRQSELAAVDIIDYAQKIERAVNKIRSKGISENDIDFTNNVEAGYPHTPVTTPASQVFHPSGGNIAWMAPLENVNDGSPWLFTGETCIVDIGTGGTGCESDGDDNEELLAVLPNIKQTVCEEINKRLGISVMPSGGGVSAAKYTGVFDDDASPTDADGLNAACFTSGGNFTFYYVLLAR